MPLCPTCGANEPGNARFCSECGMELVSGQSSSPIKSTSDPRRDADSHNETINFPKDAPELSATTPNQAKSGGSTSTRYARLCYKLAGQLTGEEFLVGTHAVIGRFDKEWGPVDVDLDNLPNAQHISRQHASIREVSPGAWVISDLGSRNCTFVRAAGQAAFQKVAEFQEHPISDGDEIALGNVKFEFHSS